MTAPLLLKVGVGLVGVVVGVVVLLVLGGPSLARHARLHLNRLPPARRLTGRRVEGHIGLDLDPQRREHLLG